MHKDLVQTSGLNMLVTELRSEGGTFCIYASLLPCILSSDFLLFLLLFSLYFPFFFIGF